MPTTYRGEGILVNTGGVGPTWESEKEKPVNPNRREMLTSAALAGAGAAVGNFLRPLKALAADVKPPRIKNIENFQIQLPATETEIEAGVTYRLGVTRVETESGVRGYNF